MPRFIAIIFLFCYTYAFNQSNPAQVKVYCLDNNNQPLQGEQIIFKKANSSTQVKGITDENGLFSTELQGPGNYFIVAQSIGQSVDAGSLILPTLKAGQSYGLYEVEVRIEPAMEFTLNNVYFESSSHTLKPESFVELDELYNLLLYKKSVKIEIAGHTDDVGEAANNLQLSEKRAESVKNYLVSKGIAGERLLIKGYGESMPIADNSSEAGRKINRRTEVRIVQE